MWKWMELTGNLLAYTPLQSVDDLGFLIHLCFMATRADLNDLLLLSHSNSRSGAPKLLRSMYERTVTIKYLTKYQAEVPKFIGYQSLDLRQVIAECEKKLGTKISIPNLTQAAEAARKEYKAEACPQCGRRRQTDWTPKSVNERSQSVGLSHMHSHAYVFPSKSLHTTFYGLMEFVKGSAPIYNVLNVAHELIVHNVLVHRRHCVKNVELTPMVKDAIQNFLEIWTFSETSFDDLLTKRREGVYTLPFKGECG